MSCLSLPFWESIFVWLVVVVAVVAIFRIFAGLLAPRLGEIGGIIVQVLNIVIWAIVAIFVIYLCFDLISCLLGSAPRMGR